MSSYKASGDRGGYNKRTLIDLSACKTHVLPAAQWVSQLHFLPLDGANGEYLIRSIIAPEQRRQTHSGETLQSGKPDDFSFEHRL